MMTDEEILQLARAWNEAEPSVQRKYGRRGVE